MKKYRNKLVVEAVQWFKNGDHPEDDIFRIYDDTGKTPEFPREGKIVRYYRHPDIRDKSLCKYCKKEMRDHGWIGVYASPIVCPGDWIIKGVKGEYYSCHPDIFEETYQLIEEETK